MPLLIGIDGADGMGKSSLASWLAWQLGMPTVHLDFYLIHNSEPLAWMVHEIDRLIGHRIDGERPMIIEGTFLLDVMYWSKSNGNRTFFSMYAVRVICR